MALFGRPSAADDRRAERVRFWVQQRSPFALAGVMFGTLAVLDFFTGVIGIAFAIAAVVCAALGLRDLRRRPALLGRRLCIAGFVLGGIGFMLSLAFFIYFSVRR